MSRNPLRNGSAGATVWDRVMLLAAGVVALLMVAFATTWGAGISPDSVRYVGAARGVVAGQGVSVLAGDGTPVPLTKWPPAFPILLAIPGLWGLDALEAARWANALFLRAMSC